jgi:hypothetical protein
MFESPGIPPPSCQMDGVQEETWCLVNTPSLNLNFRLFTRHLLRGRHHTQASVMSHNAWH